MDTIRLGADSLCWHLRLEYGGLTTERMLEEAAEAGCEFVQLSLHHVRHLDEEALEALAARATELGLPLLASGDFLGSPRHGNGPAVGIERVKQWLTRAMVIGSPVLRVVSGFYRPDLAGRPDALEAERDYVTAVLEAVKPDARAVDIRLLLENHSDFSGEEFAAIIDTLGSDDVGVFLDLINPISAFEPPLAVVERLAPLAPAGHIKDFLVESMPVEGGYHRRGFVVNWRYPGEGEADLEGLLGALESGRPDGPYHLSIEGLDSQADIDDQRERLRKGLAVVRERLA